MSGQALCIGITFVIFHLAGKYENFIHKHIIKCKYLILLFGRFFINMY